jgi:hypothetical protein
MTTTNELKVRALNGYVLAKLLAEQYNKVAILVNKDNLCFSLVSSLYSNLLNLGKKVNIFLIGEIDYELSSIINENYEVIAIFMGKNTKEDKVINETKNILSLLKNEGYEGDFFLHMRVFKALKGLNELSSELRNFLNERAFTYGFNFERGTLEIKYIDIENNKTEIVREYPLLFEHYLLASKEFAKK